jgi:hypothetical protein
MNPLEKFPAGNRRIYSREFATQNSYELELAKERVWEERGKWYRAVTSLNQSWNEIPQANNIKRGDLILYRHDNSIPNIHCTFYPNIPVFDISAYPDKVNSIQKGKDRKVLSVTVTEAQFTALGSPFQILRNKNLDSKRGIPWMRRNGYLRDIQKDIPAADFRLFKDINKFLMEKFKLQLPEYPQEMEFLQPQ